jgi:hypothetical protein
MHPLDPAWQALIAEFDTAQARAAAQSRSRAAEELNQTARRLKQYKRESDWYDAVLDGAARFAPEVAMFAVQGNGFALRGTRGLTLPSDLAFPASRAAAFRNALDSGELVVALAAANEISEPVASAIPNSRAILLPISNGERIAAMLVCVARDGVDTNALELIASIAGSVLERHSRQPVHLQIAEIPPAAPGGETKAEKTQAPVPEEYPDLDGVPEPDKLQHVRARRLARVKVAEMQLYRPEACHAGRLQGDVYLFLKREIDSARDTFREQFLNTKSMIDYLHLELLAHIAQNDDSLLGADYPGQMV